MQKFAAEGCRVIATDLNEKKLRQELSSVEGVTTYKLDVTSAEQIKALAEKVGSIDILFNCVG